MPLGAGQTRVLQRVLKQAGLYDGPIDGRWTSAMTNATARWQRQNGLPVTGRYDTASDQYLKQVFGDLTQPAGDGKLDEILTPEVRRYIEENYGYLAHFLSHRELGPIIALAAKAGWDQTKLFGAIQKTAWWKQHSEHERDWERKRYEDPATAALERRTQESVVRDIAQQMGLNMGVRRLSSIVEDSLRFGWTDSVLKDILGKEIKWGGGRGGAGGAGGNNRYPQGQIGTDMRRIMAMADDWMVTVRARQAFHWAKQVATGQMKIEDVTNLLQSMATAMYPQLGDRIKAGITPKQFFDVYRQQIAQTLEVSPESIDFTRNPVWAKVVSYERPNKNGNGTTTDIMNLAEAMEYARQQPEYRRTKGAEDTAMQLTRALTDTFGQTAPRSGGGTF